MEAFFEYYPRRVSQVLFVDAPWVFFPAWEVIKPLMRKYAALVSLSVCSAGCAWYDEMPRCDMLVLLLPVLTFVWLGRILATPRLALVETSDTGPPVTGYKCACMPDMPTVQSTGALRERG